MGTRQRVRARRARPYPIARGRGLQGGPGRDQGEGNGQGGPEAAGPGEEELKLTSADAGRRARQPVFRIDTRCPGVTRPSSTVDNGSPAVSTAPNVPC